MACYKAARKKFFQHLLFVFLFAFAFSLKSGCKDMDLLFIIQIISAFFSKKNHFIFQYSHKQYVIKHTFFVYSLNLVSEE